MIEIIKVNKKDEFLGLEDRDKCHKGRGILHRAFSILILNRKNQILLSKRSRFKKLWPFFWDNTCSSHPLKGQSYVQAGKKRLKEEFGFTCPLKLVDKYQYQARYKNVGSENEVCALLVGKCNPKNIKSNKREISDWEWVNLKELKKRIKKSPRKYTPWLKIDLKKLRSKGI